jgi:Predicted glycosyltransferases
MFSFIVCIIDSSKLARFSASLHSTFATTAIELIHIDDARSLCEGYARGAARARGDYLVFCHDDIVFLDAAFHDRLLQALESADLVGVCGTTRLRGATIAQSASGTAHGWVAHDATGDEFLAGILSTALARVDRIQALDGVFMAARRTVVDRIGFDAETFDGFHLYDLDFTYRAFKAGFRLRVQSDLLIAHASFGNFGRGHAVYAERFLAKHPELLKLSTEVSGDSALFFQSTLPDVRKVRNFYAWINHWTSQSRA